MNNDWEPVTILRQSSAVMGSPFEVKLRYRRLHTDPQIAPIAAKRPVQELLIFKNISAPVAVGDVVRLPDGSITKIIDVRNYISSLQCMLQRLPYISMPLWSPMTVSAALLSDKSLPDLVYSSSSPVLSLIEPHGLDQPGPLPIGAVDRRSAWVFSMEPLTVQSVLQNGADYWLVTASSSVWPTSNDYRAPVRRLLMPPLGVS